MANTTSALPFLPVSRDLTSLRSAVNSCRGCELYLHGTQAVFGEGPSDAIIALVGEQPGDKEDLEGRPFVGPAGKMLDRALLDVGWKRDSLYVTNAVKHFRWIPRGKRRIHDTPRASEVRACRPWLEAEIDAIEPRLIVCLGSVAVSSLLPPETKVLKDRGKIVESTCGPCLVTVHPSSLLRIDDDRKQAAYDAFVADLRKGKSFVDDLPDRG